MTDHLPPPLTPARSDLRDFGFMPLEVTRFRGSDLVAMAEPEAIVAAMMLWTAAWHETPAASLTNDDRLLAKAAGFGRSQGDWLRVKDEALRGFVECSDGRLYHPVVARLANDAWKSKVEQRWRAEVARRRKWNERHPDDPALALPSFESFAGHYPAQCPEDTAAMSQGQLALVRETDAECSRNIGSKGESRDSKGTVIIESPTTAHEPPPPAEAKPEDLFALVNRLATAGGVSVIRPTAIARETDIVKGWITKGISVDDTILPVIARRLADMGDKDTVGSLAYFDAAILKAHATQARTALRKVEATPPLDVPDQDDERIPLIRDALRSNLGARTYEGWIAPTAMKLNGTSLTVLAPSRFMADWITQHFSPILRSSAKSVTGTIDDVRITA